MALQNIHDLVSQKSMDSKTNISDTLKEEPNDGYWDKVITPKVGFFSINMAEILHYKDLISLFVKRDFVAKYKQTILGPLWHIIQPALTTLMSFLLFNVVANISTDGKNPILFQLSGIVIWSYFAACLTNTANTFITNAKIFGKVYFPRLVSPLSIILSNMVQLAIQFGLLLAAIIFYSFDGGTFYFSATWLLVPLVVLLTAGISLGLGIIISSLTTKYRDLQVLVTFGVQLLMFGSAVNYPLSRLENLATSKPFIYNAIKWNPMTVQVESFRNSILGGPIWYGGLVYCFFLMLLLLALGTMVFNRVEKTFMDTV